METAKSSQQVIQSSALEKSQNEISVGPSDVEAANQLLLSLEYPECPTLVPRRHVMNLIDIAINEATRHERNEVLRFRDKLDQEFVEAAEPEDSMVSQHQLRKLLEIFQVPVETWNSVCQSSPLLKLQMEMEATSLGLGLRKSTPNVAIVQERAQACKVSDANIPEYVDTLLSKIHKNPSEHLERLRSDASIDLGTKSVSLVIPRLSSILPKVTSEGCLEVAPVAAGAVTFLVSSLAGVAQHLNPPGSYVLGLVVASFIAAGTVGGLVRMLPRWMVGYIANRHCKNSPSLQGLEKELEAKGIECKRSVRYNSNEASFDYKLSLPAPKSAKV